MYPLEAVYGHRTYRTFEQNKTLEGTLVSTRQSWDEVCNDGALHARSYTELVDIVSFLSVMNKRCTLYFRGQAQDWPLIPAIFRSSWTSLSGTRHSIPHDEAALQRIWKDLNDRIASIVLTVCKELPMPRPATLRMFREAVWAVAQHYELWPTPLIDITQNLRTAASFALWGQQPAGFLYVVALPASTNSVTFDADQHVALARLQAVCPPVAKRPHYQDGFLAGRFPFASPVSNTVDRYPDNVSNLGRRLIARIKLTDSDVEPGRGNAPPSGRGFWSSDFPRMSVHSLLPKAEDDQLLSCFLKHASQIDEAMQRICQA